MSWKPDCIQITTDDIALYNELTSLANRNKFFKLFGRKWIVQRLYEGGVNTYPYKFAATMTSVVDAPPTEKDAAS
jgi:hypothetical protein